MFLALKRDDLLRGRFVARIGAEGEQRTFAGRAVMEAYSLSASASPAIQDRLEALVAHLTQDQAALLMVAADIDEVDVVTLQARDDRVEVLVALVVGLVHLLGDTALLSAFLVSSARPLP